MAEQHLTEGGVHDWGDVAVNGIVDGVFGAGLAGAPTMAGAYVATARHVAVGGGAGKWAKVTQLWNQGDHWEAAYKYFSMAPRLTRARDVYKHYRFASDLIEILERVPFAYKLFQHFESPSLSHNISINVIGYLFRSSYSYEDFDGDGILDIYEYLDNNGHVPIAEYTLNDFTYYAADGCWTYVPLKTSTDYYECYGGWAGNNLYFYLPYPGNYTTTIYAYADYISGGASHSLIRF
ncbi:unnamed protein product, partial [marine sediment metagenome]